MVKLKKPYIRKYSEVSGFTVWIVDGRYIRNNMNREFTNYSQHYQFDFIPKKEFWIDKEKVSGEEKYYIDAMIIMDRLLAEGVSHDEAVKQANAIERAERAKSRLMKKEVELKKNEKDLLDSIHKRLLKKYSNDKVKVWIVDGEAVRDLFFIDFVEGGHGYVYPFIPKDEIWIDDDVSREEAKFVLLHELHERNLMAKGWCYDTDTKANLKTGKIKKSAHQSASKIEYACRRGKKDIDKELRKEIKKNKRH